MSENNGILILYGHNYCPQVSGLRRNLDSNNVDYEWREVTTDYPHYQAELKALAGGYLSVPTVIFPDGSVMVEPPTRSVLQKLGLS